MSELTNKLSEGLTLGAFRLDVVNDGLFKLDGGAMFGVVPKALWNRLEPADAENRITLGLNCLLVRSADRVVLIDTGIGDKYDSKFGSIFGIEKTSGLLGGLASLGVTADQVTHVVMSHMHFDHIGGNTFCDADGSLRATFPNAVYYAQAGELETAKNPDPRSRASYLVENWGVLEDAGQLELVSGDVEVAPGISYEVTGGHTRDHAIVKITSAERTVAFMADLVPTPSHLKTPYVMGYDLYPMTTMQVKPAVLERAHNEQWLLVFEHSAHIRAGYLQKDQGKWKVEPEPLLAAP